MTTANPECVRCRHTAWHHRLDDSLNLDPTDSATPHRCVWPLPDRLPRQVGGQRCDCPDMIVPPDAGWPYNAAPPPEENR